MPRMPYLARQGKRSKKSKTLGEPEVVNREDYEAMELDSRLGHTVRHSVPPPSGQVIHHHHPVPRLDKSENGVAADIPGAAGDEDGVM